ncbi:uncharacterized protein [Dermacentor albipictus]|uniref:uncharacterized protein isoform X2 n=1 Tax=Dermacentor albipictus TaxID=60249 RepID=UPI0031FDD89E
MFKRCLFFMQLFTGLAAFPECTTKAFLDASPLACHHALMFPHARDDCPISALEDSHGLFTAGFDKILTSAIGDVSLDGALMRVTTPAPFSIKATPQLHRFSGQGSSNTGQMFKRCLFFMQLFTGLAAFPECTTKAFLDASPLACHHALMFPHARDDCPISALEDSHGLFTAGFDKILTSAIGDVSLDGALMRVTTPAPFSIKATPQLHRFSGQGSSNTGQMFKRCLFFMQGNSRHRSGPQELSSSSNVTPYQTVTQFDLQWREFYAVNHRKSAPCT